MRDSIFSRVCDTAARVCAFDRTLIHAFEQIDADARIERARGSRWATCRAWVALARTLLVGVPVALFDRMLALGHTERAVVLQVFGGQVAWLAVPHFMAWFLGARPAFDVLAPWVYLISNAAGVQVVRRVADQHRAGALTGLIGMTTVSWAAVLLMEVTVAVNTWPGSATLLMRGLVLPLMAGQVIWLSALATMTGRRSTLPLSQAVPLSIVYGLAMYVVVPAVPTDLATVAVLASVPLTSTVTIGVSVWITRSRRHA